MIEWFFSGLVSLATWLWHSAMTLYYLAGFFVVVGGLIMFVGSVIHHFWKRSTEAGPTATVVEPRVTICVENMTLEVTEPQLDGFYLRGTSERCLPAIGTLTHPVGPEPRTIHRCQKF